MSGAPAPGPPLTHGTSGPGRDSHHRHDAASAPVLLQLHGPANTRQRKECSTSSTGLLRRNGGRSRAVAIAAALSIAARCTACKPALPVLDEGGHYTSPADPPRSGLRVEGHAPGGDPRAAPMSPKHSLSRRDARTRAIAERVGENKPPGIGETLHGVGRSWRGVSGHSSFGRYLGWLGARYQRPPARLRGEGAWRGWSAVARHPPVVVGSSPAPLAAHGP